MIDACVKDMVSKGYAEAEVRSWIDYLKERKDELLELQKRFHIKSTIGPSDVLKIFPDGLNSGQVCGLSPYLPRRTAVAFKGGGTVRRFNGRK